MNVKGFHELECWKACRIIVRLISQFTKTLPQHDWDMKSNMTRAARSTTRNIAEGYGRFHYKENIQFCRISRGSLEELKDDLITCFEEDYITKDNVIEIKDKIDEAIRILNGYIPYLNSKL